MSSKIPRGEHISCIFGALLAIILMCILILYTVVKPDVWLTIFCVFQACSYLQERKKAVINLNPEIQQLYLHQQMLPKNQMVSLNLKMKTCQSKTFLINTILYVFALQSTLLNCIFHFCLPDIFLLQRFTKGKTYILLHILNILWALAFFS